MNINNATVTKIEKKEKLSFVSVEKGGKTVIVKAWNDHPFLAGLSDGVKVENAPEVEKKDGKFGEEFWFKSAPKQGGRGGGVAKSDPAKNKTIEDANKRNNASIDAANRRNSAVTLIGYAVTILGEGANVNDVRTLAMDLGQAAKQLAEAL